MKPVGRKQLPPLPKSAPPKARPTAEAKATPAPAPIDVSKFRDLTPSPAKVGAGDEGQGPPAVLVKPTSTPKAERVDNVDSLASKIGSKLRPIYQRARFENPDFKFSASLKLYVNPEGEIRLVAFSSSKSSGISEKAVKDFLKQIADRLRSEFRFAPETLPKGKDFFLASVNFA